MSDSSLEAHQNYTNVSTDVEWEESTKRFILHYKAHNNLSGKDVNRKVIYNYGQRGEDKIPSLKQVNVIWSEIIRSLRPEHLFKILTKNDLKMLFSRKLSGLYRTRKGRHLLDEYNFGKSPQSHKVEEEMRIFPQEQSLKYGIFYKEHNESAKTKAIMGSSFSGKTYFLTEELNKLRLAPKKVYDLIILFTESPNAEPLQKIDKKLGVTVIPMYIPKIVRILKQINTKSDNHFRFLVVLDDVISNIRGSTFMKQVLTMRNSQISTTILLQYPKLIAPSQRNSIHDYYFTQLRTDDWLFILKGFIGALVKPLFNNEKNYMILSESIKDYMHPKTRVMHFNQVTDKISFLNK